MIGITKVRNEEEIMQDALDDVSKVCDGGIVVYDDCSTDDTVGICLEHDNVLAVVQGEAWNTDRYAAEWQTREAALMKARLFEPEWILCFDADERFEFPETNDWMAYDGLRMRLFDFYITDEDKDENYAERKWCGPEYRDILMAFKLKPGMHYRIPDQREMVLDRRAPVYQGGFVRHYGKAISIEQWEETCDYYAENFPEPYKTKWANRRGKAVHVESDFGRPLITWDQRSDADAIISMPLAVASYRAPVS
jgi:glycosyltransferase involved in cell wall biosynthesis